MASIFTGLYPSRLGVFPTRHLSEDTPTLSQMLTEHGYETFCISNNSWFSTEFGLSRGFARMHKLWQTWQTDEDITLVHLTQDNTNPSVAREALKRALRGNVLKNSVNLLGNRVQHFQRRYLGRILDDGAKRTLRPVQRWIQGRERPWFAVVHYLEAHLPYKPPIEWMRRFTTDWAKAEQLLRNDHNRLFWRHLAGVERLNEDELAIWRDLYRAEIAYQDFHLGELLSWLEQRGELEETVVIAVGDHGESLGEHGLLAHQYGLYETLLHVPLVISGPGIARGLRVEHPVSTTDLFQTLLDLSGVPAPHAHSVNLLDTAHARAAVVSEYGMPRLPHASVLMRYGLEPSQFQQYMRGLTALRLGTEKLIVGTDGSVALYDLQNDPAEEQNLAESEPEKRKRLEAELAQWWAERGTGLVSEARREVALDAALEARLHALGYLD